MRILKKMPIFSTIKDFDLKAWYLKVDGLVKNLLKMNFEEILRLPKITWVEDFQCVEGWKVKGSRWEGVAVTSILNLAQPPDKAGYVAFHAGSFVISLSVAETSKPGVLLAYRLNNAHLPLEHGAPLRLIVPYGDCFQSVKWVERLELTEERKEDTGRIIALSRIGKL